MLPVLSLGAIVLSPLHTGQPFPPQGQPLVFFKTALSMLEVVAVDAGALLACCLGAGSADLLMA
jgi:hypothetical protein